MAEDLNQVQERKWQILYERIAAALATFGRPYDYREGGDCFLLDENLGWFAHQLEFQNSAMFQPACIKALQALLAEYPDWEILVRVDIPETEGKTPGMGIVIANDEIVDELRRDELPPEFRDLKYEGSRRVFDGG